MAWRRNATVASLVDASNAATIFEGRALQPLTFERRLLLLTLLKPRSLHSSPTTSCPYHLHMSISTVSKMENSSSSSPELLYAYPVFRWDLIRNRMFLPSYSEFRAALNDLLLAPSRTNIPKQSTQYLIYL
ncbi:hypothetical protein K458DRAFT_392408 [Lentithecium fluviatile CBS 122367]|uniref:Uncharacterized protein n=1 Tax=Lentithecium fluviatile CBS 122367 TaxID=1168545 RepID=A0A6G1IRZ4_9PLEO|nr:hypothetical protein K458DRAFT_392408 [Lentithecium fluviatile CBS 122367]